MSNYSFNPLAPRVAKAKFIGRLGRLPDELTLILAIFLIGSACVLLALRHHQGLMLASPAVALWAGYVWIHRDLRHLTAARIGTTTQLDQLLSASLVARYKPGMTARDLWTIIATTNEAWFLMARFGLQPDAITAAMGLWTGGTDEVWDEATRLATASNQPRVSAAVALCALFNLNPALTNLLTAAKLTPEDLLEGARWIARLEQYQAAKRPIYGGIARDWASGFTPLLSRYGTNISREIEFAGQQFGLQERTTQLDALITALNSANGNAILVGEPGIGKSALLLGLADQLLQGKDSGSLAHHQIFSLNASLILSSTQAQGDIERVVLSLISEASHARNIVVALDEAQLFFGQGTGAVNLSQVLLPVLQARSLKLVLAVSPGDWQRLRATNTAMASFLTPLVLSEPDQKTVMQLLADRALILEQGRFITTYGALLETYRLSGRYFQEEAYPGRALKLLEAATNYPDGQFINERSVQQAIENQFGVKVQQATSAESDVLLHLEDKIHERMIDQTRAVSVVANALRRARAGVANPRRPIGSFLFLGPTGVGKTELAKSIAALYFNSEKNVIRLDMSEYQQVADVDRILAGAGENSEGLLPSVRQAPFSVILFDEIEKAHPNVLNLFLQLLDEGNLTDTDGKPTSFKDAIVIATSNAGADEIRQHIQAGEQLEAFEQQFTNNLISSGAFKPELLNRFDEIVLFKPLGQSELGQIVRLMLVEVNATIANQKISVELSDDAVAELVTAGYDPRLGARPMRRMVQRRVEDAVAGMILRGDAKPGDIIKLTSQTLGSVTPTTKG